jgi:hypothetical protein
MNATLFAPNERASTPAKPAVHLDEKCIMFGLDWLPLGWYALKPKLGLIERVPDLRNVIVVAPVVNEVALLRTEIKSTSGQLDELQN